MTNLTLDRKSSLTSQKTASHLRWALPSVIFIATVLVFLPSLQNGFLNWDDDFNLTNNTRYRGLGLTNLLWMFKTFHAGHYHPLTWLSFALDYQLWGMNPVGYHLTNVLLHGANAVLFYFVCLQLFKADTIKPITDIWLRMTATLAALLFSIHPLRVESVTWATERRDVLSGCFLLLAVLFYLRAVHQESVVPIHRRLLVWSLVFYGMSLLSKAIGMTLPVVLLILDVFPLRRLEVNSAGSHRARVRRLLWEKLPYVVLAMPIALAAIAAQREAGALVIAEAYDPLSRMAQSLFGVAFYLVKTIAPTDLSPLYEIPLGMDPYHWRFIRSGAIVLVLSLAFFFARRRWPAGLASWMCYLVLLAPVLGLAQSGSQMVADRYTYLACMPWAALAASGLAILWQKSQKHVAFVGLAVATGIVVLAYFIAFGAMTWTQQKIWRDSLGLWQYALSITPSRLVYLNLGNALELARKSDQSINILKKAVDLYPDFPEARYSLGKLLFVRGEVDEAEKHLRVAAALNPDGPGVSAAFGVVLSKQGKTEEAMRALQHALAIDPHDVVALNNLGSLLARQGNVGEAVQHFQRTVDINPDDASAHSNMARALLGKGDSAGALVHLRKAVELNPNDVESLNGLAMVLVGRGELDEALKYQRRVRDLRPSDADSHTNLAITLANQGSLTEATQILEKAVAINPNSLEAHSALARVLAARGKEADAIVHYQQALKLLKSQRAAAAKQ